MLSGTMPNDSPKAQYQAGKLHLFNQRVEPPSLGYGVPRDNAFHPVFLRRGFTVVAEVLDEPLGTGWVAVWQSV